MLRAGGSEIDAYLVPYYHHHLVAQDVGVVVADVRILRVLSKFYCFCLMIALTFNSALIVSTRAMEADK